ncbi:ankyrin repeat domain-containing protein [Streptomyces sp. NPDC051018]|uniref:ankyrin repeat domain-containing protein n=1 Tax=Streptomyces sp. NPDC051018 TaxID=3365639 RepID=UPI0037B7B8C7
MSREPEPSAAELFTALYEGDEDAVVRLLRAGLPADTTDGDGQTPLYLTALQNDLCAVRLLLAAGAEPERPSGFEGGDLPLCGAAVGGHTEVVRALLAAGARPGTPESMGFTAMTWAVRQGYAATVRVLLEHGADPDLPGPQGEPPLVSAVRRGSPPTVRALLEHGASAKEAALAEARAQLALDVGEELRRELLEPYESEHETVSRRVAEDGGTTVVVELLRDGRPAAGRERGCGHAAIATLLEAELGIRTPYEELAGRALGREGRDGRGEPGEPGEPGRPGDREQDNWIEQVRTLWRRGGEETFQAAVAWCASDDPRRRAFGADVLGHLGVTDGAPPGPFGARAVPVLRETAREAVHPELIRATVLALGHHGDPAALPEILRHAGHPQARVRLQVAQALFGLVPGDHTEGVGALIALSRDGDERIRDWATTALAVLDTDAPGVREALADRLDDRDTTTAAEAVAGLAKRQDPRAIPVLIRILADEDPKGYARQTALDAVGLIEDESLRTRLEGIHPRCR